MYEYFRNTFKNRSTRQHLEWRVLEGSSLLALFVFIIGTCAYSSFTVLQLHHGQGAAVITAVLVDLTNQNRNENQLGGLIINPTLVAAAQAKADDEVTKQYFAHVSPEGLDSWHWFQEQKYSFAYAGENLAVDFSDSQDVVAAWMKSPSHRANILNGHFTETGIAMATGMYQGHPTIFVVQMFGTPRADEVAAAPVQVVASASEPTEIALATTLPKSEPKPTPRILGKSIVVSPTSNIKKSVVATTSLVTNANTESTSTAPIMATIATPMNTAGTTATHYATQWDMWKTSPKTMLEYAYFLLTIIIMIFLFISLDWEFKMHHVRHVGVAFSLVVFMIGIFSSTSFLLFSHPVVVQALTGM